MIPGPEEATPEGGASPGALAAGLARTTWQWLAVAAAAVVVLLMLLWGANRPEDPEVIGTTDATAGQRTPPTPADGLAFEEIGRMVGEHCLKLLVADTVKERESGLRHRESEVERVDGMLFVGEQPSSGAFTMSGVTEPLQLGFFDLEGRRIGGHDLEPCDGWTAECPSYPPPSPWSFAIETAPGNLPEGDLGGECRPDG